MPVQVLVGLEPAALAQLAESTASIWLSLQGSHLTHASLGRGVVTQVQVRPTGRPLIDVQFEQHGPKLFNDHVFLKGLITEISVEIGVAGDVQRWLLESQYLQAIELIAHRLVSAQPSLQRRPPAVTPSDLRLCFAWCNMRAPDDRVEDDLLEELQQRAGSFEASRLVSARRAECAVRDYYIELGSPVRDVSIEQLSYSRHKDWQRFDLDVGYSLDVKNARATFNANSHFSEHAIARFKQDRNSQADIRIVGVRSPYFSSPYDAAAQREDSKVMVLGEVSSSEIRSLQNWMEARFGRVLTVVDLWSPKRLPGWIFEYPGVQYEDRLKAQQELQELVGPAGDVSLAPGLRLLCALGAGAPDADFATDRLLSDLRNLLMQCGTAKRCLIMYSMGVVLEAVLSEQAPAELILRLRSAVSVSPETPRFPLGLYDPFEYTESFFSAFEKLGKGLKPFADRIKAFRLRGPDVLEAVMTDGSRWTMLAYCGGWITGKGRCGSAPLVVGALKHCEICKRLACAQCGYCQERCPGFAPRMQLLPKTADSRNWAAYRDDTEAADQDSDDLNATSNSSADSGPMPQPIEADVCWPPEPEDDEYWQSVERDVSRGAQ